MNQKGSISKLTGLVFLDLSARSKVRGQNLKGSPVKRYFELWQDLERCKLKAKCKTVDALEYNEKG